MSDKIRTPIIWFAVFSSLMLFQTSFLRLGTITAFSTLALCIITSIIYGTVRLNQFKFPKESQVLLAFILISVVVTVISSHIPSYFGRYIAQIILFLVISTVTLNRKEEEFLKIVFCSATLVYAALTIYSCIRAGNTRYIHSDIILFNARLDPNFIGIPFVAASTFVLDNILNGRKRAINIIIFVIISIATVYTSSRSNLFCFAIVDLLVILNFLHKKNVKRWIKLLWTALTIIAVIYGIRFISFEFAGQWERMITFGVRNDNGRLLLWKQSLNVFLQSPFFGNGLGYVVATFGKATHNTYIQVLCETGVIGFLLFISFIIMILKKLRRTDAIYTIFFVSQLLQISFLDALDNRCFWITICWMTMLPVLNNKENTENVYIKEDNIQMPSAL